MIITPSQIDFRNFFLAPYAKNPVLDFKRLYSLHNAMQSSDNDLLHITTKQQNSIKGILNPSAGGLTGCLYCVPVKNNYLHNLGKYLVNNEIPYFLNKTTDNINTATNGYLFKNINIKIGIIDYLQFGCNYFDYYINNTELQKLIPMNELEIVYMKQLSLIKNLKTKMASYSSQNRFLFSQYFAKVINQSPVIQMLYFELILEYIFLYQNDDASKTCLSRNELYNGNAKQLIFDLNPELKNGFSLKKITVSLELVDNYLVETSKNGKTIIDYEPGDFVNYLATRLMFYIEYYLADATNLKGQVIFRHFNQRKYFETKIAEDIWQEAKEKNIDVLTYRMPKGELGLLPASRTAYFGHVTKDGVYEPVEKTRLTILEDLVSSSTGLMRNPYTDDGLLD